MIGSTVLVVSQSGPASDLTIWISLALVIGVVMLVLWDDRRPK